MQTKQSDHELTVTGKVVAVQMPPAGSSAVAYAGTNLLVDPLITTQLQDGEICQCSLPGVLHYLLLDRITCFPRLRAHQAPAWHALLVQLAALALGEDQPGAVVSAEGWARRLRGLTPQWRKDEPWTLVANPEKPAFLQPPAVDGLSTYKGLVVTPDDLDILVTSKNHDLKRSRMSISTPEDWLFALVSLQTQEGVMGAGKYGIARMNGGYGSRCYMRWSVSGASPGASFSRDLTLLQSQQQAYLASARHAGLGTDDQISLLWLHSWQDNDAQLQMADLHPLFVEVCRCVRLVKLCDKGIVGLHCSTSGMRVNAAACSGVVADPWMPVQIPPPQSQQLASHESNTPKRLAVAKSLSITRDGFSYQRMVELLFGTERRTYQLPLLARPSDTEVDQPMQLICSGLCRGQGKTQGYHHRVLQVPAHIVGALVDGNGRLAAAARERLQVVLDVQGKCLRPALISLFQKGPREPDWQKPSSEGLVSIYIANLEQEIDRVFFPLLWDAFVPGAVEPPGQWLTRVQTLARVTLEQAMQATPATDQRCLTARACALNIFEGAIHKNFTGKPAVEDNVEGQQVSAG